MSETPGMTDEREDQQYKYGYSKCTPRWAQFCNNPKVLTAWLTWMAFVEGFVVHGITKVNIPDLERRYDLSSSQSGLIPSAYPLSAALLVLPVTIFGSYFHQPRIIAIAAFIMSMGSLFMAIPQFTSGLYEYDSVVKETCDVIGNTTMCEQASSGISGSLYMFVLGQIMHGIGGTTVHSLGIVYIDSNVSAKDSPVYQAMVSIGVIFGPSIGFLVGSQLLTFYVDFYTNSQSGLSMDDPRWVGAWWLGYLISSALGLTVAIGIAGYPRRLPKSQSTREYSLSEKHQDKSKEASNDEQQNNTCRNILGIMKATFCHPTVMLVIVSMTFQEMTVSGFSPFMSKYVQNQFQVSSSWAALVAGFALVAGGVGGMLAGGVMVRVLNLKIRGMLVLVLIQCLIFPAVALGFIFAKCENPRIPGITFNYGNNSSSGLASNCNAQCGCSTASYKPVCGADNLQYFSPCHAGCQNVTVVNYKQHYFNCSCVTLPSNQSRVTASAREGSCETGCNAMTFLLVCATFTFFLTFVEHVPTQNIILRSVPESHRTIALGLTNTICRIIGGVPASVIYGSILDSACLQWQEKCGERGSCWIYDTTEVAVRTYIFSVSIKLGSILSIVLALFAYRSSKDNQSENRT